METMREMIGKGQDDETRAKHNLEKALSSLEFDLETLSGKIEDMTMREMIGKGQDDETRAKHNLEKALSSLEFDLKTLSAKIEEEMNKSFNLVKEQVAVLSDKIRKKISS